MLSAPILGNGIMSKATLLTASAVQKKQGIRVWESVKSATNEERVSDVQPLKALPRMLFLPSPYDSCRNFLETGSGMLPPSRAAHFTDN